MAFFGTCQLDSDGEEVDDIDINDPVLKKYRQENAPFAYLTRSNPPHDAPRMHILNSVNVGLIQNPTSQQDQLYNASILYLSRFNIENEHVSPDTYIKLAEIAYPDRRITGFVTKNMPNTIMKLFKINLFLVKPALNTNKFIDKNSFSTEIIDLLIRYDSVTSSINLKEDVVITRSMFEETFAMESLRTLKLLRTVKIDIKKSISKLIADVERGDVAIELSEATTGNIIIDYMDELENYIVNTPNLIHGNDKIYGSIQKITGLIIPINGRETYIQENYLSCMSIIPTIKLTNNLELLTDGNIMLRTGVYIPYSSRNELVSRSNEYLRGTNDMIFRPLRYLPEYADRIINPNTLVEFNDLKENIEAGESICMGSKDKFYHFDYFDAIESAKVKEYINPITGEAVSDSLYDKIIDLANSYPLSPNKLELLETFSKLREQLDIIFKNDLDRKREYREFSVTDQAFIDDFFRQVFNTGMYMRRWKGPGFPYPLNRENTMGPDPNDNVARSLENLVRNMKIPPSIEKFIDTINPVEYKGAGKTVSRNDLLMKYLNTLYKGEICIRMASTVLIGTAYRHFIFMKGEKIDGLDIDKLDLIA